jgi:hypothetical protein
VIRELVQDRTCFDFSTTMMINVRNPAAIRPVTSNAIHRMEGPANCHAGRRGNGLSPDHRSVLLSNRPWHHLPLVAAQHETSSLREVRRFDSRSARFPSSTQDAGESWLRICSSNAADVAIAVATMLNCRGDLSRHMNRAAIPKRSKSSSHILRSRTRVRPSRFLRRGQSGTWLSTYRAHASQFCFQRFSYFAHFPPTWT